jgi:photosystem II stability/assembly factor-like uncharacterized protein
VSDERVESEVRAWLAGHTEARVPDSLRRFLADLPSVQQDVDRVRPGGVAPALPRQPQGVLRLLTAAAVVVALAAGLGYGLSQRPGPPASNAPASPPPGGSLPPTGAPATSVVDAALVDAEHGWALTDVDLVWTDDGGSTWTSIRPPDVVAATIRAVHFIDPRYGWIVWLAPDSGLATPTVERTTDGGRTWSVSHVPDAYPDGVGTVTVEAADAGTVWIQIESVHSSASSSGGLYLSRDGGVSWVPGITIPGAWPVRFRSQSDGWTPAGPLRDELDATTDGGLTWHPVRIDLPSGHGQDSMAFDLPTFTGDEGPNQAGVLPVTLYAPPGSSGGEQAATLALYTTADGGTTWRFAAAVGNTTALTVGVTIVSAIADQTTWLAAAIPERSSLSKTTDGGRTWAEIASPGLDGVVDRLRFVDASNGLALARRQLSATTDGGRAWHLLDPVARTSVGPSPSASVVAGPYRWELVSSEGEVATYDMTDVIGRRDGSYLAVAYGQEARVITSSDGRTWTVEPGDPGLLEASSDHSSIVEGVAEGATGFVAVGANVLFDGSSGDARAWTSADGIRWQAAEPPKSFTDASMESMVAGPDGFVAVGSDGYPGANIQLPGARGAAVWSSADGRSWARAPAQASFVGAIMTGVRTTSSGYVAWGQAIANTEGPPQPPIWTSSDGIRWARASGITDAGGPGDPISSVLPIGNRLVAVGTRQLPDSLGAGSAPGAWLSIDDGRTWSASVVGDSADQTLSGGMLDVASDGSGLVAVGRLQPPNGQEGPGSAAVWRSSDAGSTWTQVPDDPSFSRSLMNRIVSRGTGFIVFGSIDDPNAAANVTLIWVAEPNP